MKKIHEQPEPEKQKYREALKSINGSGDLHKLAIFDMLMGNNDRHLGNVILSKDSPKFYMIDAGRTIDYSSPHATHSLLTQAEKNGLSHGIHPEAQKWLDSLDEKSASDILEKFIEPDSKFKQHFLRRLYNMKMYSKHYKNPPGQENSDKPVLMSELLEKASSPRFRAAPANFEVTGKVHSIKS